MALLASVQRIIFVHVRARARARKGCKRIVCYVHFSGHCAHRTHQPSSATESLPKMEGERALQLLLLSCLTLNPGTHNVVLFFCVLQSQ